MDVRYVRLSPVPEPSVPVHNRPAWVLVVCTLLVLTACGSRRTEGEFAQLLQEGYRPDLVNAPAQGSDGAGGGLGTGGGGGGGTDLSNVTTGGDTSTTGAPGPGTTDGGATSGTATTGGGGDATSGSTGGGGGDAGAATGGGEGSTGGGGGGQQNTASDVGVTPTSIKVGFITSINGPLGPGVFSPPVEGAQAYFQLLNARGGVNGRTIEMVPPCDDKEDPSQNRNCVERLVNQEKVFALIATSTRAYEGAKQVSDAGVPDVGGQPIGSEMYTYPTMFTIRGSEYAQDGTVGQDGTFWGANTQIRWFRDTYNVQRAGVIHYEIPESRAFAVHIADHLENLGIETSVYSQNAALPNWDSAVSQMKSDGITALWDTLDLSGNQNLCRAMERQDLRLDAKVSTSQGWTRRASNYSQICLDALHAVSESRPNADTNHPGVAEFRETMVKIYGQDYESNLHQWHLEGWAAAKMFTDAVASLGANVTRKGVMDHLRNLTDYTAEGLLSPIEFTVQNFQEGYRSRECLVVSKWNNEIGNFTAASPVPFCLDDALFRPYEPAT